jgi:dTDP-4-amino-4,6-dideoxygalactose transaminase
MSFLELRSVPFFNYPHVFKSYEAEFMAIFADVGRRGAFIDQKDLKEFEADLAVYTGARYALGVADGTDALIIAAICAGVQPGDEVIFCTHTMVATAASIHFAGATPVAVECGPDHLIDPVAVESAITKRTKAIFPTQLNGRVCDMERLQAIADRHGLLIIEDAAQALGAKYKGRAAGTFGLAGTISFYPAKTLGSLGDGGAILTNDAAMFERMRCMRDHGRNADGEVVRWGLNSRLDNLQAAFLHHRLRGYDESIRRRREIASLYHSLLGDIPEVVLPPAPCSHGRFDIFQNFEIEAEHRDELKSFLASRGVGTLIQWGGRMVHQFKSLQFGCSLPNSERLSTRMLMLPLNLSISNEDVAYVADGIRAFYRG